MAQVPATSYESTSLGDVAEFTIPFPFLSRAEVFVTVDGASVAFTWINDGLVQLAEVPELGAIVRRYRSTEAYVPLHQFSQGVPFLPRYVDRDFKQTLYAVQESVNDTAGTAAQALATAEESLILVQDAFDILGERTQYMVLGPYTPGLEFQTTSQVFSYLGEFYAPGPSITLPYTTTGAGAGEIANFRSVGDAILRSDLADDTDPLKGAALVGYKGRTVAQRLGDFVSVKDFGAIGDGVADDSAAIQAAHDSFLGNDGGTIFFPRGRYRMDSTVNITKAGVRLVGVSPRSSMIISRVAGVTFNVKVLYNGTSNTDAAYCKFGIDNLAIGASYYGSATVTGTGLLLQNVFADTFTNVYVFGFKKHIVFNGVHMMKFSGIHFQSAVQDHPSLPGFKTVIHNRPLAISGTSVINDAGESGGVGNSFDGGWFENVAIDTTHMGNTVFTNIDFEPASNSMIIGDQNIFENNRFERFGIYAPVEYPYFPWFVVNGEQNRFKNNHFNVTGAVLDTVNPVYVVNGAKNDIELPEEFFSTYGLLTFGAASFANTVKAKTTFADYQNTGSNPSYKNELTSILLGGFDNTIIYSDGDRAKTVTASRSSVSSNGEFKNLALAPNNLHNAARWSADDATISRLTMAELPAGRGNLNHFAKVTLTAATGNRRFYGNPSNLLAATAGVYSAGFMLYIPPTATTGVLVGASLGANYEVNIRDTWVYVRVRGYFNVGDPLVPTVRMLGGIGDYFMVGEVCVCAGQLAAFSPQQLLTTNNNSGASAIPPRSAHSGAGVLAGLYDVPIVFSVQDNVTPGNYCISVGIFPATGSPVLTQLSANVITLGATNAGGTVTINGSTDYTILVRPL